MSFMTSPQWDLNLFKPLNQGKLDTLDLYKVEFHHSQIVQQLDQRWS